jgi:hypothetical protein
VARLSIDDDRNSIFTRANALALVDIDPVKIQRLLDRLHLRLRELRKISTPRAKRFLGISPETNRIAEQSVGPETFAVGSHRAGASGFDIARIGGIGIVAGALGTFVQQVLGNIGRFNAFGPNPGAPSGGAPAPARSNYLLIKSIDQVY